MKNKKGGAIVLKVRITKIKMHKNKVK